ncbi:hypothetical protein MMC07_000212 [Pseudocyphellaria aurata]|nr:hypothetical protein [Pseudocyphellaria aurata]
MHLSSLLPLVLFTSLISAQAPPDQISFRDENVRDEGSHAKDNTIMYPSSYQQIRSLKPRTAFPQNLHDFNVTQTVATKDYTDTLLRFSGIPRGSYSCELTFDIRFIVPIHSSGSTQLNVYALPLPISAKDTYETYYPNGGRGIPKGAYLFGTTTIITGQRVVINSQACKPSLGYLFRITSDTKDGSVSFNDLGNNDLVGISGFYLTYFY